MLTNPGKTTIYTGVTNDLQRRIAEHRQKLIKGFTARYNLIHLVYYEVFEDVRDAIAREKQLKAGSRKRKVELIESINPEWKDLYDTF
jgi:putative endonuclease